MQQVQTKRGVIRVLVWSFKLKKKQVIAAVLLMLLAIGALWTALSGSGASATVSTGYDRSAETDAQRKAFLAQCGWQTAEDPMEVREVIIPAEFNAVYTEYNALQQAQGFDLARYKGKRVKRWTYEITNYPDQTDHLRVYADLLVYGGQVIGGNVGTREVNGFMHGFRYADGSKSSSDAGSGNPGSMTESPTSSDAKSVSGSASGREL